MNGQLTDHPGSKNVIQRNGVRSKKSRPRSNGPAEAPPVSSRSRVNGACSNDTISGAYETKANRARARGYIQLFLSHKSKDQNAADEIFSVLKKAGGRMLEISCVRMSKKAMTGKTKSRSNSMTQIGFYSCLPEITMMIGRGAIMRLDFSVAPCIPIQGVSSFFIQTTYLYQIRLEHFSLLSVVKMIWKIYVGSLMIYMLMIRIQASELLIHSLLARKTSVEKAMRR
jgi:hypothetical protein